MLKKVNKIAVLTSGGDAPGMNAAIRAVVRTCSYHEVEVLGIYRGFQGMIEDDFVELNARSVRNIINKGGTFLKSARSEGFRTKEGRESAYKNLTNNGVEALVVIGGDGTFTGALSFSQEFGFPVMGIPGTIDNDIYGTTHTIGYDTALNTVVDAIDKIRDTASSHNRMFFVEVMGRDSGFIALNSGIGGGAERIIIPEKNIPAEVLLEDIDRGKRRGKTSNIIVVAEGNTAGKAVFELKEYVEQKRPEYDIRVSVLGHMQRGGTPTCYDRVLATRMGVKAVESLLEGKSQYMVGINNDRMELIPLEKAVKENDESKIDKDLIRITDIMSM
ncbi:MAG: 6-phosphofructokinase [Flavobacteriaceae bacterium]|jgi:6-phosphofructokinase|nr:6-phosphofructokinase [Flavobacteriaceae bacterium]